MKKNIEWLKKEIGTEMIQLEPNRAEKWSDVKYQALRSVAQKLDQLDEPEVTLHRAFEKIAEAYPMTREEVCRHLEKVIAYGGKVTYGEPEVLSQELPVIPKYVADWITKHRDTFDLYPMLKRLEKNSSRRELTYKWYRTNTHEFVNAYLTGEYEVEEEPLYYALIKGHDVSGDSYIYWNCDKFNNDVIVSRLHPPHDDFSAELSKSEWNELGINDSNADFVRVEENE